MARVAPPVRVAPLAADVQALLDPVEYRLLRVAMLISDLQSALGPHSIRAPILGLQPWRSPGNGSRVEVSSGRAAVSGPGQRPRTSYVRTATRGAIVALPRMPAPVAGRGAELGHQGPRLRARGRDERLRRLRPGAPRPRLPLDPRPLLPPYARRANASRHPVRVLLASGVGVGRVQEGEEGVRQAAPPSSRLQVQSLRAPGSRCVSSGGAPDRPLRARAPRAPEGGSARSAERAAIGEPARQGVGRRAAGHERGRPRRLRDGGRPERDAVIVVPAGASCSGGGGAIDRAVGEPREIVRRL